MPFALTNIPYPPRVYKIHALGVSIPRKAFTKAGRPPSGSAPRAAHILQSKLMVFAIFSLISSGP